MEQKQAKGAAETTDLRIYEMYKSVVSEPLAQGTNQTYKN